MKAFQEQIKGIKILFFVPIILLVLHIHALGNNTFDNPSKNKYCVEVRDGKLVVLQEDKIVVAEVTLNNGARLTPEANLIQKDGTSTMLKAGECVDMEGAIEKAPKENSKNVSKKYD